MVGLKEPRRMAAEADDDDGQPEEVTLVSGREEAEGRRKAEQASRRRVAAEAKQKRRKWAEKAKEKPQGEPSPPEIADSSGLLQEDVVRYLAAREKSGAAQAEPPEDENPAPQVIDKKRRKPSRKVDDQANRVRVVVLDENLSKGLAQSAQDFRHDRLFGSHVRRSVAMLSKTG